MWEERGAGRLLVYGAGCLAYVWLGAALFTAVEGPEEAGAGRAVQRLKAAFLEAHPCLPPDRFEAFLARLQDARKLALVNASLWAPPEAYFFVVDALTTVGYGNTFPTTTSGMIFCVLYCALGLPVVFRLFENLVDKLVQLSDEFYLYLRTRLSSKFTLSKRCYELALAAIVLVGIVFLPAAVFARVETDWSYLDAVYFCVTSVTKIGLGDYVPGEASDQPLRGLYKIFTANFLLVSVIFTMYLMALIFKFFWDDTNDFEYEEIK